MNRIRIAFYTLIAFAGLCAALSSCKPDTNSCDNCETELITSLYVTLTDSATGAVSQFAFRDLDGTGSNAPVQIDTIRMKANNSYDVTLLVLDESKTPADTISNAILEEANDHQFFFQSFGIPIEFIYRDFDTQTPPQPLGLQTKWRVGNVPNYHTKLFIDLRHQPGIKNGNISTGETDLSVEFLGVTE